MRTAVLFLLFLCWHLAGGCSTATATGLQYQSTYVTAQGMEKVRHVSTADATTDLLASEYNSLTEDISQYISIEDDEEDDATRKHASLARYILAAPLAFPEEYHYNCPGGGLSRCKPSSCINIPMYIIHSTLKI